VGRVEASGGSGGGASRIGVSGARGATGGVWVGSVYSGSGVGGVYAGGAVGASAGGGGYAGAGVVKNGSGGCAGGASAGIPVNLPIPAKSSPGAEGVEVDGSANGLGTVAVDDCMGAALSAKACCCCSRQPGGAGTSPNATRRGSTSSVIWRPGKGAFVG